MSGGWSIWIPGLVVLGAGLVGGLLLALRYRRKAPATAELAVRDLELRIADLESRRYELYERLRDRLEETADPHETLALEGSAARVLRELDQARGQLAAQRPAKKGKAARAKSAAAKAASETPAPPAMRHPMLVGAALGGGMVGLVALLIFFALGDAKPGERTAPRPRSGAPPSSEQPADMGGQDHPGAALDAEAKRRVEELRAKVAAGDPMARKELAVFLLENAQFFPAFQESQEILRANPNDPDGLYVEAVVRLQMGQPDATVELIDRVLAQFPDHVLALLVKGVAELRLGRKDDALATWERGLEAAGGHHPELEQFIADARSGRFDNLIPAADGEPASAPPPPSSAAPPVAAATGPYRIHLELAPGLDVPAGASLFVSIDGGSLGAPAAVKRLVDPKFPVELELDSSDSMMGDALPAEAMVTARLDRDGNIATDDPEDPWARAPGRSGSLTKLVLTLQ